jgi:hypothetical protein
VDTIEVHYTTTNVWRIPIDLGDIHGSLFGRPGRAVHDEQCEHGGEREDPVVAGWGVGG